MPVCGRLDGDTLECLCHTSILQWSYRICRRQITDKPVALVIVAVDLHFVDAVIPHVCAGDRAALAVGQLHAGSGWKVFHSSLYGWPHRSLKLQALRIGWVSRGGGAVSFRPGTQ